MEAGVKPDHWLGNPDLRPQPQEELEKSTENIWDNWFQRGKKLRMTEEKNAFLRGQSTFLITLQVCFKYMCKL